MERPDGSRAKAKELRRLRPILLLSVLVIFLVVSVGSVQAKLGKPFTHHVDMRTGKGTSSGYWIDGVFSVCLVFSIFRS